MISDGMQQRGHKVTIWEPIPFFYKLPFNSIKKWLGYIDQYIVFPLKVKEKLRKCSKDTIFVFADQALGPWVPLVVRQAHVVHCHDFLALNSSLGYIPENPRGKSGKIYQSFIRSGFSQGKHFISISNKTQQDLHELHQGNIMSSVVCYNGLNRHFAELDANLSRTVLGKYLNIDLSKGYILHVGGNQYYKNRRGVIEIYNAWRTKSDIALPLLMVGAVPPNELKTQYQNSLFKEDIYLITGLADEFINSAYSGATCLLFPSLDEGFGWPIAEAMASGTLVITTNKAPMTEVVGKADSFLIARKPFELSLVNDWAINASKQISIILNLTDAERLEFIKTGLESIKRFDTELFLDEIEKQYLTILKHQ
jgi:glycosyltransferase involved in cell wall biosynthesis